MLPIYLIGFMGSGKTSVGKNLAPLLKSDFVDLDEMIEKREKKSISEIFQLHGEEYFREKESQHLRSLSEKGNAVIATGGGTPCFHENMHWMNSNGMTVYLKTDAEVLFNRLKGEMAHRPLLKSISVEELKNFISSKLEERESFYLSSKFIVETNTLSAAQIARHILALLS